MQTNSFFRILSVTFLIFLAAPVTAQLRNDDKVVRSFVSTRGTEVVTKRPKPRSRPAGPIALGYTLFRKDENGKPVRVNPSQEFRSGDNLRFVIESNTDGYLYIFHQTNNAPPKMIYPDARLKLGDNRVKAHVQSETPSKQEPGNWWFNFFGAAGIERFYLVVSRMKLTPILSGERLVAHCGQHPDDCSWRPADTTWKQLLAQAETMTRESRSQSFGDVQTEAEQEAIRRDVKLQPSDPAPAVIKVNASPAAGMIMTTVEIVHKD